jgi:hypothetical protein
MTFLDVVKLASVIMVSLGGGGAIVFGLSGFLGKLWADRALEKQRHEYGQLTQQMQHQLDAALKRVQVELDTLGLIHNLRTKEEFTHIGALWKSIANLGFALHALLSAEILFQAGETEKWNEYKVEFVDTYKTALNGSQRLLTEEMIFIPAAIAEVAQDIVLEP